MVICRLQNGYFLSKKIERIESFKRLSSIVYEADSSLPTIIFQLILFGWIWNFNDVFSDGYETKIVFYTYSLFCDEHLEIDPANPMINTYTSPGAK